MASVKFIKPITRTPNSNLIFEFKNGELLSQEIKLKLDIKLDEEVQKPIKLISLYIEIFHTQYCYIKDYGNILVKNFHNRGEDFITNNITFKIGIIELNAPLDKEIKLKIYIRDANKPYEIFPLGVAKNVSWMPSVPILNKDNATPVINNFIQ